MRVRKSENILEVLLKQCYTTPRCQSAHQRRQYSTEPHLAQQNSEVKDVAVLGGGITGLASAYYLSQELPKAKITLYESSTRLGGWLHSKRINVGNGQVVFEQGPRTLRPGTPTALVTLNLIHRLELEDQVLPTPQTAPAAMNRFIYYPNHLVRMPGPGVPFFDILYAIFNEPLFNGIPFDFGLEAIRSQRPKELLDESVGSFLARRYSPALADNIASAVLHGIYAGDVYKLSVKSLLPLLWFFEEQYGSIARGIWKSFISKSLPMLEQDAVLMKELMAKPILTSKLHDLRGASVYTFKRGIGELADQLEVKLKEASNVDVKMEMSIGKIEHDGRSRGVKVYAQKTGSLLSSPPHIRTHTHTISTLSSSKMAYLCGNESLPTLSKTHSVTVMVVNMYFSNPNLLSFHGFGYLIPRSVPFEQNPERALGVVFDSDATIGQDTVLGTKVTVMLGGHWWDGWDSYPDEDEGRQMGLAILHRHLKITEQPTAVLVGLQRECIPQYFVGHDLRMATASQDLEKKYKGRLRVAGNSYTGVGLNDCVRAARDVVKGLVARDGVMRTGLESFTEERIWVKAVAVPRKPS